MDTLLPTYNEKQFSTRARSHDIPICSDATRTYIETILSDIRPRSCLEIGAAVGYMSCHIGRQIAWRGGSISAFEVSFPSYHIALRWRNHTHQRNTKLYHTNFLSVDIGAYGIHSLDFVFIDGMKAQYADYLQQIRPYCHETTIIVCDDVIHHRDKMDAFRRYLQTGWYRYEIVPLGDGDGVAVIRGFV